MFSEQSTPVLSVQGEAWAGWDWHSVSSFPFFVSFRTEHKKLYKHDVYFQFKAMNWILSHCNDLLFLLGGVFPHTSFIKGLFSKSYNKVSWKSQACVIFQYCLQKMSVVQKFVFGLVNIYSTNIPMMVNVKIIKRPTAEKFLWLQVTQDLWHCYFPSLRKWGLQLTNVSFYFVCRKHL